MSIAYDYDRAPIAAIASAKPRLLIDGRHVPSASGCTFKTLNPANEQVIATVAEGNEADVDRAVAAARRAFEGPWRSMRASERGQILLRLAELMKRHADEIAALESLDAGKPIAGVLRQDLPAAIDTLTYYAGWADKISGEVVSTREEALTYTMREPVGVVAAIVPWNFPLMIGMWKLAPALACGCTIVMKPAELTSLSALRIGERVGDRGYFISPAVFADVEHQMRISQEEIFGPVVSVIKFKDEAEALRIANGTAYSLAAGVWSRDIGRVQRFAKQAKAGTVWINTYGYTDVRLPWGGVRDSGFGREHGTAALENFTEPKAVWMNLNV